MYLQLATDHILVKKNIKLSDGRLMTSKKRIWQLLWRGFSVDDVCNIIQEEYMYWDNTTYWQEKKEGIIGRFYFNQYNYSNNNNRYRGEVNV
jgi:hypothetical protein